MDPHQQIGVDVDAQIASGRHWFNKSAVNCQCAVR